MAYRLFGYARGEIDGKNVSILMPQPFSSKHDSFLSNYLSTGHAKILNTQRGVVALKKVRCGDSETLADPTTALTSSNDIVEPHLAVLLGLQLGSCAWLTCVSRRHH